MLAIAMSVYMLLFVVSVGMIISVVINPSRQINVVPSDWNTAETFFGENIIAL